MGKVTMLTFLKAKRNNEEGNRRRQKVSEEMEAETERRKQATTG
jgi:hypothetical protein